MFHGRNNDIKGLQCFRAGTRVAVGRGMTTRTAKQIIEAARKAPDQAETTRIIWSWISEGMWHISRRSRLSRTRAVQNAGATLRGRDWIAE